MTVAINFYAFFVASAVGATGLTVTVDIDTVAKSDGARSAIVTGGSAVEGIDGYYHYRYATADLDTYDYIAIFKTAGTADQKSIPSLWSNYAIGESARIAAIPTTVPLTAADIRAALGMASANMDTQFTNIPALFVGSHIDIGYIDGFSSIH